MLDFVSIKEIPEKKGTVIVPEFNTKKSKDLMIRGKAFYAVWDEEVGFWTTNEHRVQEIVDGYLYDYLKMNKEWLDRPILKTMADFSSNIWTQWQKYCKSLPDNYQELDSKILFDNDESVKSDYATKKLPYPIVEQDIPAYDEIMSVLYDPVEREKIEWGIGAIIAGDSKWIQKFMVLYGDPGTGKSTILNIIQDLFDGYYSLFNVMELTNGSQFGLESLKNNSLIAIQHDGDLSRIADNTQLNSIVSHEEMVVNEKFKSKYSFRFHSFLWMGTNKPVKITDSKSGVIRRLIDIHPTGNKIPVRRFNSLIKKVAFEYSGIAYHCLQVYENLGADYYDGYIAEEMITKTNDFYNFIEDNFDLFEDIGEDGQTLSVFWRRYKDYCDDANVPYPVSMRVFKDEMKNYFREYHDRMGKRYSVYVGFIKDKFKNIWNVYHPEDKEEMAEIPDWLQFDCKDSLLDDLYKDCPAQNAGKEGNPKYTWDNCKTVLSEIDTKTLHWVRPPLNHIVIDFDIKDDNGEKSLEKNIEAASKFPKTYAELSKSGSGIHLHYYYDGDITKLANLIYKDVEIKVFAGKSSLRRKVIGCNSEKVATISSGLPFKEVKKMIRKETIQSERRLRSMIAKNLLKQYHANTKPSIDFIYTLLEDAYESGLKYDVRDMQADVLNFALGSTNQSQYCVSLVDKMKFCSEEVSENIEEYTDDEPITFFDVEVFPNLFVIVYKEIGEGRVPVRMINPSPQEVEELMKKKLVGFNNRRYDNHLCYARMMGYSNERLFEYSSKLVEADKAKQNEMLFGEAYNLSYTDIYDYCSNIHKFSLKKWEILLGIHHLELGLPWNEPVDKSLWDKVAEYCEYDVIATEAVWNNTQDDWLARQILAEWAGLTPNDTTNTCTAKIIVGDARNPQNEFVYVNLADIFEGYEFSNYGIDKERYNPVFKIKNGKSIYKGEDPSEGGYVYAEPGFHVNVAVLDVASMHPHSAIAMNIFGKYTRNFENIVEARVMIKHGDYDKAKEYIPEHIQHYLDDKSNAKSLANAMKTAINSVYGLTSASYPNKLRDPRNLDNIVAKRGALFMITLKYAVQEKGYTVAHIKTDSIKIVNADPDIIKFVSEFGEKYGYSFEHEATYSKMCLINDSVYVAQYASGDVCNEWYGYIPGDNANHGGEWTATGTRYQIPYVFKTLFSHEPLEFSDYCETRSVKSALYLDYNEGLPDVEHEEKIKKLREDAQNESKLDKMTKSELGLLDEWSKVSDEELDLLIAAGHEYQFVGRIGSFCPVIEGVGGGALRREQDGKLVSVSETKNPETGRPYRWFEAEVVKENGLEDKIDTSYHDHRVEAGIKEIEKYVAFDDFINKDYAFMYVADEELPFQ